MIKYLLLLTFPLFTAFSASAQKDGSIRGMVKDSSSGEPLAGATISILQQKDSSLVSFGRSSSNGAFSIARLEKGSYRLLITHVGYRNLNRLFVISDGLLEINVGWLALSNKRTLLEEVTVTQEKAPVVLRNDTLEYNAGSFKTKPNAVVEDLLKKLPGVQVDKDGKIKSNGQEVKKVLVDGKEFFGNDPKLATKNLPADAVDKVQVFDRKSEQSRFTGFDDGNSEKTINLTIKPDRKNGVFGKATAGAGDKGLYQGNFNINSFSGERQLSAIGMANNTNKQGFSFLDLLNFTGGLPGAGRGGGGMQMDLNSMGLPIQGANTEGVTSTLAGGLNYNNSWKKKTDIMGSYFYSRLSTDKTAHLNQQWVLLGNTFNTVKDNQSNNTSESNRINFTDDYKIDSVNSIRVASSLNLQKSSYGISSRYLSDNTTAVLLNDGYANAFTSGTGYSWNSSALFRHRFSKKGRTFSANLSFGLNNNNSAGSLLSRNNYYDGAGSLQRSDTINQSNDQLSRSNNYGAVLSYTEPLSKKSLLEFNYNAGLTYSLSDKHTYDLDMASGKYNVLNAPLSNNFSGDYYYQRPGVNFRHQTKKINYGIGLAAQQAWMQSGFHSMGTDSAVHRNFFNILPGANLQYSINQYKNLRLFYRSFTRQPSVSQLQPLIDNSDPLNVRSGNPDLKQEYYQRLQAEYMSFDPYQHTNFIASLTGSITGNKIVNADQVGAQGQRYTRPVNANGAYDIDLNTSWGLPVKPIKGKLNLNSEVAKTRNIGFVNNNRNNISSWYASQEVSLQYGYRETLDMTLAASVAYNDVRYSLQSQQNIQYWTQHYSYDFNLYLPHGLSLATDLDYSVRSGLSQGYNVNMLIWNAGLAKQLFHNKKGELRLQIYDILGQNSGISRTSNQNYIEDASYNVLKRFWQLSFTYNLSRFAGKNIAAPGTRGSNIQVIEQKRRG